MAKFCLLFKNLLLCLFLVWNISYANNQRYSYSVKSIPIFSLAISKQNPHKMYVGSQGCIYRIEKGECFRSIPSGLQNNEISKIAIDPTNDRKIYAMVPYTKKIWVSYDSGKRWRNIRSPRVIKEARDEAYEALKKIIAPEEKRRSSEELIFWNYNTVLAVNPLNPQIIVIGGEGLKKIAGTEQKEGYIIGSADAGRSWQIVGLLKPGLFRYEGAPSYLAETPNLYLLSAPKGIYKLRLDFKKLNRLKKSPKGVRILAPDPVNWQRLLYVTSSNSIYETAVKSKIHKLLYKSNKEIKCLVIDPRSSQTFYIGTRDGLWKTLDNGKTFHEVNIGSPKGVSINCVTFNPSNNMNIYVGTYKGLFISENGGKDWYKWITNNERARELEIKVRERKAKSLLSKAESLEADKKYSNSIELYKKFIIDFPKWKSVDRIKEKVNQLEPKVTELEIAKIAEIRARIQKVSDVKVRNTILKLGLNKNESDSLANAMKNLSYSKAVTVIKEGLGMPLPKNEASQEYRNLTLFQKFYAILCYKDYLGERAEAELSSMLKISHAVAQKLSKINANNLF